MNRFCLLAIITTSCLFPEIIVAEEFTAELRIKGPEDGRILKRLDISIDSIQGDKARVWINEKEQEALADAGIPVRRFTDGAFTVLNEKGLAKGYHDPETCIEDLTAWARQNPDVCSLVEIGKSVKGRPILAVKITDNPSVHGFKPLVRICGAHHGNEVGSSETVLMFIKYLLDNYRDKPRLARLLKERELWFIPMVNPDGVARRTRYNANYVDLNRNYGYHWQGGWKAGNPYSEPETRAVREHAANLPFSLSLSFHCSGDIINYVWNYTRVRPPDHELILSLSNGYASFNGYEVTEGCDWYQTNGDTNDWSYGCTGSIDWTIEVDNPSFSGMDKVFEQNREGMLFICEQAGRGVCGIVTDSNTGKPLQAVVEVIPPFWPAFTHPQGGDFHRVLLPGSYKLIAWAPGYQSKIINNVIVTDSPLATRIDISLQPKPGIFHGFAICEAVFPSDEYDNHTHASYATGPADGRFCSLGEGGHLVFDLSAAFPAGTAAEITINDCLQADVYSEAYEIDTSFSCYGPWRKVASGIGTSTINVDGLQRYVLIKDCSSKSSELITPGLDLDAITIKCREAIQAESFGILEKMIK